MTNHLLSQLHRHVNARGLVLVREATLTRSLNLSARAVRQQLAELALRGEIHFLTPGPFLVLRLKKWPGSRRADAKTGPNAATAPAAYSYSYQQSIELKNSHSYRHSGELMGEILAALGETDPEPFREALRRYSPDIIRQALDRIRRMRRFRKSPTALFRYLLPRLARKHSSVD